MRLAEKLDWKGLRNLGKILYKVKCKTFGWKAGKFLGKVTRYWLSRRTAACSQHVLTVLSDRCFISCVEYVHPWLILHPLLRFAPERFELEHRQNMQVFVVRCPLDFAFTWTSSWVNCAVCGRCYSLVDPLSSCWVYMPAVRGQRCVNNGPSFI
jgi:hypothetical protein